MLTTIFLGEDSSSNDFEGFELSEKAMLQLDLRGYAKKALKSDILTEADIADCFDANNNVPVAYKLTDSEIAQMVLKMRIAKTVMLKTMKKKFPVQDALN